MGSTHGIDLHTGAVHRDNYPQIPVDGVVIGRTNLPLAHEGEALFNIGLTAGTQAVARTLDDFDPLEEYKSGATGELAKTEPEIV